MSKRRAEYDIRQEDVDRSDEEETPGEFLKADSEELSKRVFKTAKRRSNPNAPNPFAAFSGFAFASSSSTSTLDSNNKPTEKEIQMLSKEVSTSKQKFEVDNRPGKIDDLEGFSKCQKKDFASSIPNMKYSINNRIPLSVTSASSSQFSSNVDLISGQSKIDDHMKDSSTGTTPSESAPDIETLKALNLSFANWIQQHLEKNPYVILLPVFRSYEEHLQTLNLNTATSNGKSETECQDKVTEQSTRNQVDVKKFQFNRKEPSNEKINFSGFKTSNAVSSTTYPAFQFSSSGPSTTQNTLDSKEITFKSKIEESGKKSESAENKPSSSVSSTTLPSFQFNSGSSPFSKAWSNSNEETKSPVFDLTGAKPNLGAGFFSNIAKKPEPVAIAATAGAAQDTSDEPPESNFVPVGEEGSVFDIRCKVFMKKDEAFASIGLGKLYLKIVGEKKTQLIVRADTAQGSVLLNLIVTPDLPIQTTGKNNILLACIPTPEAKPPPIPVLIRVKNGEERDKLLKEIDRLRGC